MERRALSANPYDFAEELAMCERLRRTDDLCRDMDDRYGRMIMDTVTFAIGMYRKRNKLYNEPDELYEECVGCALEAIRKTDPSDPLKVVRYVIASCQNKIRWMMRDKINREQLLFPFDTTLPAVELSAELDGGAEGDPWDTLKAFAIKQETDYGREDI